MKSGYIALIGRPNVGKSSFLNNILGDKISIVSPRVQTTRHNIKGIYNNEDAQIVFLDVPGIHKAFDKLGEYCFTQAENTLKEADVILMLTDDVNPDNYKTLKGGDLWIYQWLQKNASNIPTVYAVNKIDTIKKKNINLVEIYKNLFHSENIYCISATDSTGVQLLLNKLQDLLPEGPKYYSDEYLTDRPMRFIASEIIREQALLQLDHELPHSIAIDIKEYNEQVSPIRIRANIIVERNSQKQIVIGAKGSRIKEIGIQARQQLEKLIGSQIFLELKVAVSQNWRKDPKKLKEFGYL